MCYLHCIEPQCTTLHYNSPPCAVWIPGDWLGHRSSRGHLQLRGLGLVQALQVHRVASPSPSPSPVPGPAPAPAPAPSASSCPLFCFCFPPTSSPGSNFRPISHQVREGFNNKKTENYPHFVDKRLTPPPLSTSAKVNNIHTKEFFDPHSGTHPLALIHFFQN